TASEIRARFIKYFAEKGHEIVPSAPLIPRDDPTLLFNSAGMVPFKRYYLMDQPPYGRAVTSQRCLRLSDLDEVGRSPYHATFFEMLGSFSFGSYFKEEAIEWAWEFLTNVMELPAERLWVTVHGDDEAAAEIWKTRIGFPEERLVALGDKDNFWGPAGDSGPCGPCSEIHVDMGEEVGCGKPGCKPGCDCRCFFEVWNPVFPQYLQATDGTRQPLARPGIDTGMGLERMAAVLQGTNSIYETDLFRPIVDAVRREVEEIDGTLPAPSGEITSVGVEVAVISDHARAVTFTVAENILPSNEGQGYVVRRLIRRAVRRGRALGLRGPFLYRLTGVVVEAMKDAHPHLEKLREHIALVVRSEEERFHSTLSQGTALFDEIVNRVLAGGGTVIGGDDAFTLYDTYGFPPDLTEEMAGERGLSVDMTGFDAAMEKQRERGRKASSFTRAVHAREWNSTIEKGASGSDFVGYDVRALSAADAEAATTGVLSQAVDATVIRTRPGAEHGLVDVVLDKTPFYAESGGQVADAGWIQGEGFEAEVVSVHIEDDLIVHVVRPTLGHVDAGAVVSAAVDVAFRRRVEKNHTATHLLQAALQNTLGKHVHQSGSWVGPDRLRFDFTHFAALEARELQAVEDVVNAWIRADLVVKPESMALDTALERGAIALFDEKYGDEVRMITVPDVSLELCGGTHVARTGEIGVFRVLSESSVAAGTRRIEAVTGADALRHARSVEDALRSASSELRVRPSELAERVRDLAAENSRLAKEVVMERRRSAGVSADGLVDGAIIIEPDGIRILAVRIEAESIPDLRAQADGLREKLSTQAVGVLGSVMDGKPALIVFVTDDLAKSGRLKAGEIVKHLGEIMGARGGGKQHMAQAGGGDVALLDAALGGAEACVRELLGG
ncbi:alanine--tRNA ligase, partial [bacterium]|nr:alanine--tRNA ligase [bacterium]